VFILGYLLNDFGTYHQPVIFVM